MSTETKTASPVKSSKPRSKPARSLTILEAPAPHFDGFGAIRITEGKKVDVYLIRQIPADFGEGWSFDKLTPEMETAEQYDVNLMGRESSCTCPGHTYHGHCRHIESLLALDARGALPRLLRAKDVTCPKCNDVSPDGYSGLCNGCTAEDEFAARDQHDEMMAGGIDPWEERYEACDVGDAYEPATCPEF